MARISVCINNYNYRRFIGEAIDSVLAQSYLPHEVIVVDDGSTDGSAAYVEDAYGDRVRLISSENLGQLSAFRLGVGAANGDFVAFLDADDRWEPYHLAEVAKRLEADSKVDFVFASKRIFGESAPKTEWRKFDDCLFVCTTLIGLSGEDIAAETSCLTVRRTCLDFLDLIPAPMLADWKLWVDFVVSIGASIRGARKVRIGSPSVLYRAHGQNGHYGRPWTAKLKADQTARGDRVIAFLHDLYFPGMNAAAIVRREIGRNTLVKNRNKRRLYKAVWRCPASLSEKVAATVAIWAKR